MSKQRFSIAFDFEANMSSIVSSVANLKKELSGVNLPSNFAANFEKLFGKLEGELSNFQALTKNGFDNMVDVKKAETSFSKISKLFSQISLEASKVKGLDPNKFLPKELQSRTNDLKKKLGELQDQQNKKDDFAKKIEKQNEAINKQRKELQNLEIARKALEDDAKSLGGQKGAATKRRNDAQLNLDAATAKRDKLIAEGAKASNPALQAAKKDIDTYAKAVRDAQAQIDALSNKLNTNATAMRSNGVSTEIAERELADLKVQLAQMKNIQVDPQALTALREELAKIKDVNIDQISTDLQEIDTIIDGLDAKELEEIAQKMQKINTVTNQTDEAFEQAKQGVRDFTNTADGLDRAAQDMQNLQRQVQDFFSVTNSIQLFKRAITSALNTVKELDATMTEAAVVTEFDVGDMWEKLPEYSKNAQALGVSINGMYQATTLYFQQGLKNQEAMELGIETMKMAKIAGMESAEATEAMTAALRGFNMELNEASATKVNDVYSQLAAVTAADTEQIATAMEKTASIAASANMEFETTAALLAQIIETTQEAPETAGTAMKTIIARFAEVKSLREQGLTSGEDDEGEIIDVNKIQTALRSVGISMEGFFNGTEGLDPILLKLSEKWGSLDFETQRYIATMAAGSRQQSRFIAMMSDYGRTTELVSQAQNSAGASQKQFEKTQDSLETSLTRLKNAWDEFLMGLSNNEALKFGVDILTKILETINKITDSISGGNGLTKSLVSLIGVVGMLKGGRSLLSNTGVGQFLGQFSGGKTSFKETITETSDPEGNGVVRTIVKEPLKEGQQAGQQAGQGFILGFKNAIQAKKDGVGVGGQLKAMFTSSYTQDGNKARKANASSKKTDFLAMAYDKNQGTLGSAADLEGVSKAYDDIIAKGGNFKDATLAANQELEKMGMSAVDLEQDFYNVGTATETMNLNMGALGGAVMGVGGALGLLASLFESLGMEETAEVVSVLAGVFMGLGTVMTTLSTIAPMLGMSFTTAGVQITIAGVTSQLAWWWVFVIIGAIALLAVGVAALIKTAKDNSLEGRMEAAAEATERAKEAAEGAKQAYDDLLNAKSGYDELQNKLDTLTKGTLEWKQALADSNAQVLELLDKYPELTKYLTRGEHGELEITDEGWEYVTEQQTQAVNNANSAVIASQMDETRLKQEKATSDLQSAGKKAGVTKLETITNADGTTYTYEVADTQDIQAIYEKYKETPDIFESSDLEGFALSIGQTKEEVLAMKDAILQYDTALAESETMLQAQSEALLSSQISGETADYEYSKELVAGMAAGVAKNQEAREKEIAKNFEYDKNEVAKDSEYFKTLAKEAGVNSTELTGDNTHDLEVLYAKMAGISTEEIADGLKGNVDKLTAEIAKMQAAKDAGAETDKIYKAMSKLDAETQRDYAILMSKDISNANQEFINEFAEKQKTEAEFRQMAQSLGFTDVKDAEGNITESAELKMAKSFGYDTIADMQTEFQNIANNAKEEFEKIAKKANKYQISLSEDYIKKMTKKQQEAYVNMLSQADALGTTNTIKQGIDQIYAEANEEQKTKITSFLETADWTQEGTGEDFLEFLKDIGIDLKKTVPNLEDFSNAIKGINANFRTFTLSSTVEKIQAGIDEAEQVRGQSELTTEQYEKYLKDGLINSDEWKFNGKGWVNVTNGMDNLVQALIDNTTAIYESDRAEAQAKLDSYKKKTNEIDSSKWVVTKNWVTGEEFLAERENWEKRYGNSTYYKYDDQSVAKYFADNNLGEFWWQQFFSSLAEYENYRAMAGGGADETQNYLDEMKKIDPTMFSPTVNKESWKNSLEKQYNTYEKINVLINKRNKLERQYQKLLNKSATTGAELVANAKEQISNLKSQKKLQESLKTKKADEIQGLMNKNSKYDKYVTGFNEKTGEITINWAEINKIKDTDKGQAVEDYISKLESLRDQWQDTQDSIDEIDDTVSEIRKQGEDEFFDLEDRLKSALVQERQDEIDKLTSINDSINDTNSALLSAMQEQINEYRQNRDNAKTEEEIADKQRRLAYLQQDTSGANATEILKLQEEIDKAQEDYTDTLIDQKISELQKQNDAAAEQRERQIAVLKTQLESYEKSGQVWQDVYKLWQDTINGKKLNYNSNLVTLLKDTEGFEGMSNLSQDKWLSELADTVAKAFGYTQLNRANEGDTVKFTTKDNKTLTGTADADGNITVGGKTYKNVHKDNQGNWVTTETSAKTSSTTTKSSSSSGSGNIASLPSSSSLSKDEVKKLQKGLNELLKHGKLKNFDELEVDGIYGNKTKAAVRILQSAISATVDGIWGPKTKQKFKESTLSSYATGGLVDFTGPAWLDGTKSKPEYILSADQTKAFFTLVDVLGGLTGKSAQSTQNNGDTTYDIDINVEKVDSDYSVEQIAEKVKGMIVSSSRYRNNNTL